MISSVEQYLDEGCGRCPLYATPQCKVNSWREELKELRRIVLECELNEEIKWSVPTYTYKESNLIIVSALKDSATLSFFKGVLLKDEHNLLVKPGQNSQSARYMKFTDVATIRKLEPTIKAYIFEMVEVEKAGIKVKFKSNKELTYPEELENKLASDPALNAAFEALTPGRKRSYILHISSAKQSKTRESRVEKCIPKIFSGKGFNEY